MKRTRVASALVATLLVAVGPARGAEGTAAELFAGLEREWMDAVQASNLATLERVLAPEFVLSAAIAGEPLEDTPRRLYLEACKGFYKIHSYSFDEVRATTYGDLAVVEARYRQKATLGGTRARSAEFFLTDVWRKQGGHWQVVHRLSSRPEPASPDAGARQK